MVLDETTALVRNTDGNETRVITGAALRRAALMADAIKKLLTGRRDTDAAVAGEVRK